MRVAVATLILSMTLGSATALAQNVQPANRASHPSTNDAKNHPAAADPKKKGAAAQPGRDPNGGVSIAERAAIQFDLAWIGAYNGLITGEANDKTTAAVKAFQKDHRFKETGTLAQPERAQLSALSKEKQGQVGWRMADDKVTGAQIGLPTKQVPNTGAGKSGTRWFSAQGQIQVETFRIRGPGTTLADVYEQQK
jgi:peptidoglycan hydrolase-like protein with peptidoglycan-binding domain